MESCNISPTAANHLRNSRKLLSDLLAAEELLKGTRKCSVCEIEKDLSEYYKLKSGRLGLTHYCKDCARVNYFRYRNKLSAEYLEKERAKKRVAANKRYHSNLEASRARNYNNVEEYEAAKARRTARKETELDRKSRGVKWCGGCKSEQPTFKSNICVACSRASHERKYGRLHESYVPLRIRNERALATQSKECTRCHTSKPLSSFDKTKNGVLGYHSICKNCRSIKASAENDVNCIELKDRYMRMLLPNLDDESFKAVVKIKRGLIIAQRLLKHGDARKKLRTQKCV